MKRGKLPLAEEGVDGVLVGAVVGPHDCALDNLVGEDLDTVEFAAFVFGGDPLHLHGAPVVAEDVTRSRARVPPDSSYALARNPTICSGPV